MGREWWVAGTAQTTIDQSVAGLASVGLRLSRVTTQDHAAWNTYWESLLSVVNDATTIGAKDLSFADDVRRLIGAERRAVDAWPVAASVRQWIHDPVNRTPARRPPTLTAPASPRNGLRCLRCPRFTRPRAARLVIRQRRNVTFGSTRRERDRWMVEGMSSMAAPRTRCDSRRWTPADADAGGSACSCPPVHLGGLRHEH